MSIRQNLIKWISSLYSKLGGPEKSPVRIEEFDPEEYKPFTHIHEHVKDVWFKTEDGTMKVPLGDVAIVNFGTFQDIKPFEDSHVIPWMVDQKKTISLTTQDVEMAMNLQPGQEFSIGFPNSEEKIKKGWPERVGMIIENAFLQSVSMVSKMGEVCQASLEFFAYPKFNKPKPVRYTYKKALRWKNRKRKKYTKPIEEVEEYYDEWDLDSWDIDYKREE